MTRRWVVVFVAVVMLLSLVAISAAQGPVTLQYKYAKDQVVRMHMDLQGSGSIAPQGGPNMPENMVIPMVMTMNVDLVQKVKEVLPDGSTWLTQNMEKMTMVQEVMGQKTEMTFEGGKITKLVVNGKEQDPKTMPGLDSQQSSMGLFTQDAEYRMEKTGKVLEVKGKVWDYLKKMMPGFDVGALLEASSGSGFLPDHPIPVGETWKREYAKKMEVPNADPAEFSFLASFKLDSIETAGGMTLAKIPYEQTFEMANLPLAVPDEKNGPQQMNLQRMKIKAKGITWFAVEKGQPSKMDMKMDMDQTMTINVGEQAMKMSIKMRDLAGTMSVK